MTTLSVVVASIDSAPSIERCLSSFAAACRSRDAELIVVDASDDGAATLVETRFPDVTLLRRPTGTLTPMLWAEGYRAARGSAVAFTTGHFTAAGDWAAALLDRLNDGAAGVGGPFALDRDTTSLDWAVFYLRYSPYLAGLWPGGPTSGEIAGDNACYRRADLDRHRDALAQGLWEVDLHRLLRADGGSLIVESRAVATFNRSFRVRTICRHRFAHGRHYGAGRVAGGTRRAWQVILAAPFVPFLLAARVFRRTRSAPEHRSRFLQALPWFLLLALMWAAGEAWGAMIPRLPARRPDTRVAEKRQ